MNDESHATVASVGGSWWTVAAGWATSIWSSVAAGMPPLAAAVAIATLVLTFIKIAQEVRAWHRSDDERTLIKKMIERMKRNSGFYSGDTKQ